MITLTVTSFDGAPVGNLACAFDELGGCIGRADTNLLILPDPERTISRVQAQIVFRGGAYALVSRGSNPVLVNGKEVGTGSEAMLSDGDQVRMGSYVLAVSEHRSPTKIDPFEAMFGSSQSSVPAAPAVASLAWPGSTEKIVPSSLVSQPAGKPQPKGIPDDWDPFARESSPDPFGAGPGGSGVDSAPAGVARLSDLAVQRASQEDSLDALFGLGNGPSQGDPFAKSNLAPPAAMPNTAASGDPFRSLQEKPQTAVIAEADHVSDLQMPWVNARQAPKGPAVAESSATSAPVFSWDSGSRETKSFGQGGVPTKAIAPAGAVIDSDYRQPAAPAPALRDKEPGMGQPSSTHQLPVVGEAELLAALLEGLGTPELRIQSLTPEFMRLLGQLLRGATKGSVELLAARASLKREVRAEVTMIVAKANNPLKFSPSVEVALQYLLGPKMSGFMPPVESMRDAFDDLRAHQLGIMAGMEAALTGVLKRFDPAALESKLSSRSALSNLIPSSRKAKLWELFQTLYQQLATEAEDDFNALFGAAFLRAYEHYIDQVEISSKER